MRAAHPIEQRRFQRRRLIVILLLQPPQRITHYVTGIGIASAADLGLHKRFEFLGERYVGRVKVGIVA